MRRPADGSHYAKGLTSALTGFSRTMHRERRWWCDAEKKTCAAWPRAMCRGGVRDTGRLAALPFKAPDRTVLELAGLLGGVSGGRGTDGGDWV